MSPGVYTETWRVWIDYNHDGDFTDTKEKIADYKTKTGGLVYTSFIVPKTAITGNTRMRVSMIRGTPAQTSCETFSRGEVEDYTVNITTNSANKMSLKISNSAETVLDIIPKVSVFPNPATINLTTKFSGYDGSMTVKVFDVFGKVIFMGTTNSENQFQMDVHQLASGMYILLVSDEQGRTASLKWMKE